jgi:hypothetical protein
MPKPVGSTFTQQRRRYKYDFKKLGGQDLTDGRVWRLDKGKDYECGEDNLRQHVRRFADDHDLDFGFQVMKTDRGVTGVEVAFVPRGSPVPGGLEEEKGARTVAASSSPAAVELGLRLQRDARARR